MRPELLEALAVFSVAPSLAGLRTHGLEAVLDFLDDIRQAASEAGSGNVTVLQAGERATNLPAACCDAIFMRRVYHHLSEPSPIVASIHEALRPGGRLGYC